MLRRVETALRNIRNFKYFSGYASYQRRILRL